MKNKKLIYGCMGLGGHWNNDPITKNDEKKAHDAVYTALEVGIDTFDHADIYMLGKAETVFGTLLKADSGLRQKIKIQSKAAIQLGVGPRGSNTYNFSKDYLLKQVGIILQRLQTEYLDTFILHRPDPLCDPAEIAETFRILQDRGWVKNFAVSNMSVAQIDALQQFVNLPIVANQIQFSLGHSILIDEIVRVNTNAGLDTSLAGMLQYAQLKNIELQAWGCIDRGLYLGHENSGKQEVEETKTFLKALTEKYNAPATAILLAWILRIPANIAPVIGTTNPERIKESALSLTVELSHEDWYALWLMAKGKVLP
jgi:predicted oxidoreductase